MDRLPNELVLLIYEWLPAADIATLPLINSHYRRLAADFLLRELHLIYRADDFRRLRGIAQDKHLADKVRTIYFEADRFPIVNPLRPSVWKPFVYDETVRQPEPVIPTANVYGVVPRAQRVQYYRDLHIFVNQARHRYNRAALRRGFAMFSEIDEDTYQFMMNLGPEGLEPSINAASGSFRNIRTIICDSYSTFRPQSEKWKQHFGRGLTRRGDIENLAGAQAFVFVGTLITHEGPSPLRTLRIGLDDWVSLQMGNTWPDTLAHCHELRELEMHWTTFFEDTYDGPYDAIHDCDTHIRSGKMYDLLSAAPKLQELILCFEPHWHKNGDFPRDRSRTCYMARFDDCFRQDRWQNLHSFTLHGVESSADELIAFFRLHPLIQTLNLKNIGLTGGQWVVVFAAVKEVGRVAFCSLAGEFYSAQPLEVWDLERPSPEGGGVFDVGRDRRRKWLQDWVCGRQRRGLPRTGNAVEWARIWGLGVEGLGFPE
ncbi:hypothetical protein MMC13_005177 [Lambiella insularis]|nr:hypothetical protein [Lambiella insularis]